MDSNSEPQSFGISSWFKTRLNTQTDIDLVASSPPDHDAIFSKELVHRYDSENHEKHHHLSMNKKVLSAPDLTRIKNRANSGPLTALIVESYEDACSSTDTTPFATPQASPMIVRKKGSPIHEVPKEGNLLFHPKKWLYKSILTQMNPDGSMIPSTHLFRDDNSESEPESPTTEIKSPTYTSRKCKITAFDLNAISPSSF